MGTDACLYPHCLKLCVGCIGVASAARGIVVEEKAYSMISPWNFQPQAGAESLTSDVLRFSAAAYVYLFGLLFIHPKSSTAETQNLVKLSDDRSLSPPKLTQTQHAYFHFKHIE